MAETEIKSGEDGEWDEPIRRGFEGKMTDNEMALELGISRERVRQIRDRLELKLPRCACGRKLRRNGEECHRCKVKRTKAAPTLTFNTVAFLADLESGKLQGKLPAKDRRGRALNQHRAYGHVEPDSLVLTEAGREFLNQARERLGQNKEERQ